MSGDVLSYCHRKKSFAIDPHIKKILSKAFVTSNATKLPSGSFNYLYAEKVGLLEEMRTSANHIVWGRRGTGKTHLVSNFLSTMRIY